jgi:MFS family permease
VGVIQAYVADATEPDDRAKALGWLSAATNAGVAIGPALGSLAMGFGTSGPGLFAATIALVNMAFAWSYLKESNELAGRAPHERPAPRNTREVLRRVLTHGKEPASRLIWIYAITMGAFQGMTTVMALFLASGFGVTERTIGFFFTYVGTISFVTRAGVLGKLVTTLGELRLSRYGMLLLAAGLAGMAFAPNVWVLAAFVALIPLGTAFTFPCVTGLLSRVVSPHERGLYMGVQQTFGGAGRVVGPIYAGWAFDHLGHGVPFYTGAAIVILHHHDRERPRAVHPSAEDLAAAVDHDDLGSLLHLLDDDLGAIGRDIEIVDLEAGREVGQLTLAAALEIDGPQILVADVAAEDDERAGARQKGETPRAPGSGHRQQRRRLPLRVTAFSRNVVPTSAPE